jgi:DNA invertase Pin-like site-specific DNA recombinase
MNVDGYIRVSRVAGRSGDSFISPKVQRDKIKGLAAAGGHKIVKWVEDLDESGAKDDRPGFQLVLERIESGKTGGVVVAKLDRFSRSVAGAAVALKRIEAAGGAFLSAEDGFDTSTPMGRFALNMMIAMAELEWERRRESWLTARSEAVARGVHISSMTPAGYDRDGDRRLVPNTDAPAITAMFQAKARGASWSELSEIMEASGAVTNRGAVHWTNKTVAQILTNRVYLGEARSGEFVRPGAHEPLIDEATWKLAQLREQRVSTRTGGLLLSGILRCAGCRYSIKTDNMTPTSGEWKGTRVPIYRCRGKRSSGACPAPASVMAHLIDDHVTDLFLDHIKHAGAAASVDRTELDAATVVRDAAAAEVEAYLSVDVGGIAGADQFQRGLQTRQDRLVAAESRLVAAHEASDVPEVDGAEIAAVWPSLDVPERREILSASVDAIFLRRAPNRGRFPIEDRSIVLWRGQGPKGLPSVRNRPLSTTPYDW